VNLNTRKESFLGYIDEQISWRDTKAEEYPNDLRNAATAQALSRFYTFVESLPIDDPDLAAVLLLDSAFMRGYDDVFMAGEITNTRIARFGVFDPTEDDRAFLQSLPTFLTENHESREEEELNLRGLVARMTRIFRKLFAKGR